MDLVTIWCSRASTNPARGAPHLAREEKGRALKGNQEQQDNQASPKCRCCFETAPAVCCVCSFLFYRRTPKYQARMNSHCLLPSPKFKIIMPK